MIPIVYLLTIASMKNFKFVVAVVAVLATLLMLAGCGQKETVPATADNTVPVVEKAATLDIAGLSFVLPDGWSVQEMTKESNKVGARDVAKISVPDPKYNVVIPMTVAKSDHEIGKVNSLQKEAASGAKIYSNACAPTIVCYYVVYNGNTYDVVFEEPESDQPVPENLDGVWFPSTTVTADDTLNFLSTVK